MGPGPGPGGGLWIPQLRKTIGSLSNDDGNVNENVEQQWIKLQNTITARGNATICPLFRCRL